MSPRKAKRTTRSELVRLNARVWFLEQIEQREAAYRKALQRVRECEAVLKAAKAALETAATAFLGPYHG